MRHSPRAGCPIPSMRSRSSNSSSDNETKQINNSIARSPMNLLDRLLGHDAWTTRQLLDRCTPLSDEQLDRPFDIGHRTLRATLAHLIHNMETWSALMAAEPIVRQTEQTIPGLI